MEGVEGVCVGDVGVGVGEVGVWVGEVGVGVGDVGVNVGEVGVSVGDVGVSVGEVGDEGALATMAEYTADDDKLNMAYGFSLFTEEFSAARIRSIVSSSSLMPSRAKYSPCIGISTVSAATSALRVSRSSAGGQSITMN